MAVYTITGGAGFIGSHLADALLAQGCRVVVLDDLSTGRQENLPPGVTLVRGDVVDPVALHNAMEESVGCFHLAAIASVQRGNEAWLECHRVNQSGSVAVFDTARKLGRIPVVYASSAAVYGDQQGGVAAEEQRPAPLTAYGLDKLGAELHAGVGWRVHAVPSFGCRFFNVYGERQDPFSPYSGVISIFGRLAGTGELLMVHGDGEQIRDFIHVSDVVRHLLAAMGLLQRKPGAHVANVCTGRGTTILDLARLAQGLAGSRSEIRYGPARVGDIRHSLGDPSFATNLLGVSATVALPDGLARTLPTLCSPTCFGQANFR